MPAAAGLVSGLLTVVRNTTSTFLVLLLVLVLKGRGGGRELVSGPRAWEFAGALLGGVVLYWLVFDAEPSLPLGFAVLPLWVWVGWRLGLARTSTLGVVLGAFAVFLTMRGNGPFAAIESATTSAMVVQGFLLVTVLTSASLAASQEEKARIEGELEVARSALAESIGASLIGNSVLVMSGVHAGELIHPNAALKGLLRTDWQTRRADRRTDGASAKASWFRYLNADDRTAVRAVLRQMADGS